MRILVFEDNLMWGPRLRKSLTALGHEPVLLDRAAASLPEGRVALVNLGARAFSPDGLIRQLKSAGLYVIGHAGHKETDLLAMGKAAGCDQILSNGQATFGLERALDQVVLLD